MSTLSLSEAVDPVEQPSEKKDDKEEKGMEKKDE